MQCFDICETCEQRLEHYSAWQGMFESQIASRILHAKDSRHHSAQCIPGHSLRPCKGCQRFHSACNGNENSLAFLPLVRVFLASFRGFRLLTDGVSPMPVGANTMKTVRNENTCVAPTRVNYSPRADHLCLQISPEATRISANATPFRPSCLTPYMA